MILLSIILLLVLFSQKIIYVVDMEASFFCDDVSGGDQ